MCSNSKTAKDQSRDLRPSSRLAIRSYLEKVDVAALLDKVNTCTEKTKLFETIVNTGLDLILPLRSKTVHLNDPPWFNPTLKNLIKRRQRALTEGDSSEFCILRNCVNLERKICRARYYEAKVIHLKAYHNNNNNNHNHNHNHHPCKKYLIH